MTSAIALNGSPLSRTATSAAWDLPPDVLQGLVAEVRRHIPDGEILALRSLDRLTSFAATASLGPGKQEDRQRDAGAGPRIGGLAPWQANRVERYIGENIEAPIRVADLAALVSLCASHFCRAFRAHFGETPHSFVMRRRIEHAQLLMASTDEPLSQIALMCGLSDQAHLSRLFRRHFATTPSNWRRRSVCRQAA
ncbi:AraC family transcriptional regulator [Aurantimonas sp. 22II-16-19i]|uniref:helix-turn-helix transcriptional regulator n=1 Tax=Aurantimonas sp. 22II-16-19i TaxID=1317114 RepID=UPI0009F7AD65|nr:AraC family transcriptional regulator [Aurantimonas sp. 22II-16-19i]ORE90383.1 AraC family transcriptional regulator [Aurantimonas sp. 22II-16-19i]